MNEVPSRCTTCGSSVVLHENRSVCTNDVAHMAFGGKGSGYFASAGHVKAIAAHRAAKEAHEKAAKSGDVKDAREAEKLTKAAALASRSATGDQARQGQYGGSWATDRSSYANKLARMARQSATSKEPPSKYYTAQDRAKDIKESHRMAASVHGEAIAAHQKYLK